MDVQPDQSSFCCLVRSIFSDLEPERHWRLICSLVAKFALTQGTKGGMVWRVVQTGLSRFKQTDSSRIAMNGYIAPPFNLTTSASASHARLFGSMSTGFGTKGRDRGPPRTGWPTATRD